MTWFEVYIPAKSQGQNNVTLTIEGQNWMDALRTGLANIGEGPISNIMCDIQADNSIHVTDVGTQRVFRLRETAAPSAQPAAAPPAAAPAAAPKAQAPQPPRAAPQPAPAPVATPGPLPSATPAPTPAPAVTPAAPPAAAKPKPQPAPQPAPAQPPAPAAQAKAPAAPPPKRDAQFKTGPQPAQRVESATSANDPQLRPSGSGSVAAPAFDPTDMIADIFDATQELLMDSVPDASKVAERLLDLALEKVPADAGTFYLADVNGHELRFAAVRGPKADAIKKSGFTVPVGQGIVGFSAQEGVCLVIRDMQHDSRYFRAIADAVGYQPRDTLCASAEKEGRLFGAIQLINSKRGGFSAGEMEVIRYIGLTAADMLERVADSA